MRVQLRDESAAKCYLRDDIGQFHSLLTGQMAVA